MFQKIAAISAFTIYQEGKSPKYIRYLDPIFGQSRYSITNVLLVWTFTDTDTVEPWLKTTLIRRPPCYKDHSQCSPFSFSTYLRYMYISASNSELPIQFNFLPSGATDPDCGRWRQQTDRDGEEIGRRCISGWCLQVKNSIHPEWNKHSLFFISKTSKFWY